jgi:YgiT-type zinc finger domain-containing protein
MYGYKCEYCEGKVQSKVVEREAFKHKNAFVILESIVVGVCDRCGNRYYTADILHTVHEIATGKRKPERIETIPVAHLTPENLAATT